MSAIHLNALSACIPLLDLGTQDERGNKGLGCSCISDATIRAHHGVQTPFASKNKHPPGQRILHPVWDANFITICTTYSCTI